MHWWLEFKRVAIPSVTFPVGAPQLPPYVAARMFRPDAITGSAAAGGRSEERRVGKEDGDGQLRSKWQVRQASAGNSLRKGEFSGAQEYSTAKFLLHLGAVSFRQSTSAT